MAKTDKTNAAPNPPAAPPAWLVRANQWFTGEAEPVIKAVPEGPGNTHRPWQAGRMIEDPEFDGKQAVLNLCRRLVVRKADPDQFTFDYWVEAVVQPGGQMGSGGIYPGSAWKVRKVVAQLVRDPGQIYGIYGGDDLLKDADPAAVSLIQAAGIDGDAHGFYD